MAECQNTFCDPGQVLKPTTFNLIRQLVYEKSGISLGENKQALVRSRISKRMRRLNISDFDTYINYVLNDGTGLEMSQMLDAISTNTTHFYREASHFEFMRRVIRGWIKNGNRKLRIWCTASSTGEEPYTLAIETLEAIGHRGINAKILATDIAASVLRVAMRGIYSEEKVKTIPENLRSQYFNHRQHNNINYYSVKPALKNILIFRQLNLSAVPYPLKNPLDMIFCRNVMIYFDQHVRTKLVYEFQRLIRRGGYLFVGHSESITAFSDSFKCIHPSVYVRI